MIPLLNKALKKRKVLKALWDGGGLRITEQKRDIRNLVESDQHGSFDLLPFGPGPNLVRTPDWHSAHSWAQAILLPQPPE